MSVTRLGRVRDPIRLTAIIQASELVIRLLVVLLAVSAVALAALTWKTTQEKSFAFFFIVCGLCKCIVYTRSRQLRKQQICVSIPCNIIDSTCLALDMHYGQGNLSAFRAWPRWRGVIDSALMVALIVTILNLEPQLRQIKAASPNRDVNQKLSRHMMNIGIAAA